MIVASVTDAAIGVLVAQVGLLAFALLLARRANRRISRAEQAEARLVSQRRRR
jgi:hypothetical protein